MNGGYFMTEINADLAETSPQNIKGAYNNAKKAIESKKPIIVYGLKHGSVITTPIRFFGWFVSSGCVLNAGKFTILIDKDDKVNVRA